MGIRSKAKKIRQLLPVVGAGGNTRGRGSEEMRSEQRQPPPTPAPNLAPPSPSNPRSGKDPMAYIEEVVKNHAVVLFMKGSPAQPQCGFFGDRCRDSTGLWCGPSPRRYSDGP